MYKTREELISALQAQIAADPEGSKESLVGDGSRSFSLIDILKEIEDDTESGKRFVTRYLQLAAESK